MTFPPVGHIAQLALNVEDLDRSVAFYVDALGFRTASRAADRTCLALGSQQIVLFERPGATPYPRPRAANDPWFQHFAVAVADMEVAYARLSRFSPEPITRGGPQLLPPSTGSVTAYKFRDPDGHPLELSHAPGSSWSRGVAADGAVFLGIDHTALVVRSLDASVAFYTALGFRMGAGYLNLGPEQARLDGRDDAVVDIVTLFTPEAGPHLELLHYQSTIAAAPREIARDAIAATTTIVAPPGTDAQTDADTATGASLRDPDGHRLCFTTD